MSKKYAVGEFFTAPLLGGGYTYGYFTYYGGDKGTMMSLCNIYDYLGDSPDVPEDIESYPLLLTDLRISREEFTLKPKEEEEYGKPWIISKRPPKEDAAPECSLFIMGYDLFDIIEHKTIGPASAEDKKQYQDVGHDFAPTTTNTIEVAYYKLDIDPDDYYPEDFPDRANKKVN